MRAVHGEGARGISFVIGRKAMEDSLREYEVSGPKRFMRLVVPYKDGEDPEYVSGALRSLSQSKRRKRLTSITPPSPSPSSDAFSSIPYNKGSNLILLLGASSSLHDPLL